MNLQPVAIEHIHQVWPIASKYIADGLEYAHDEYTLDQVKQFVSSGQWYLFVVVDDGEIVGATVVNVFNRPNDRVAFVMSVGGKGVVNKDIVGQLKQYAAACGATKLEAAGRDSVVRLLSSVGFAEKYKVIGMVL